MVETELEVGGGPVDRLIERRRSDGRGGPGTVGLNPLLVDGGNILLLWGLWEVGNRWWSRRKAREDE